MSRGIGAELEHIACQHLINHQLTLINQNYTTRFGEIDLIMRDIDMLVFVEVRYRRNIKFGHPIESITKVKQNKMLTTALHYLSHNNQYKNTQYRFDVVTILGNITKIRRDFNNNLIEPYINWYKNFTIEEYGYYS